MMSGSPQVDKTFSGSIPELYETYLVPLIFKPYAADLAKRLALYSPSHVLEVAAGTGALTRQLAKMLPDNCSIVATDLNQSMLDMAAAIGANRPVLWRQADAMQLPFPDASFDAVACQFGAMFFPDKAHAFAEARRVLKPGGVFIFSVWDRIEENAFADVVTQALAGLFPQDLANAGFAATPQINTVTASSQADSPSTPAMAYCQGTPLRNEIEARDPALLDEATELAAKAIAEKFGSGPVEGKMQAHVFSIKK